MNEHSKCLSPQLMERIARVIGDTNEGLTGSEIGRYLVQSGL